MTDQVKAKPAKAAPKQDNSHLIEVFKGGESLHVHPTALTAHKQVGWREAE